MPKVRYRTCRSAGVPRARDRWGFCTIRSPLSACRRRVAALMLQFPPRGDPRRRIQGARRPVSADSRGTATGLSEFKGHGDRSQRIQGAPWPTWRIQGARRPVSANSRGTATGLSEFKGHGGPRKAGSRPGTCSDAARSKQFRMQFDYLNIQQTPQTLQFQRCEFVLQTNLGELHATLGEATRQRVTQPLWRRCGHCRPGAYH